MRKWFLAVSLIAFSLPAFAQKADPPPSPAQVLLKARELARAARDVADGSEWRAVQDFAQAQENDIQLLAGKVGWWQDCATKPECWEWVKPK